MPSATSNNYELSFNDARLNMTVGGRFVVRIVSYLSYIVLFALMCTFFVSGSRGLEYVAAFLALFFLDLWVHRREPDVPISELAPPRADTVQQVNLALFTSPRSFSALDRAFDKSLVARQDFYLTFARELMDFPQIRDGLTRLDADPKEFRARLEDMIKKSTAADKVSKADYLARIETLAIVAFGKALKNGHDFIELTDYFAALGSVDDKELSRLFTLFSIEPADLELAMMFAARGVHHPHRLPSVVGGFMFESHRRIPHRIMNRAWTSRPTPTLDAYGTDFTDLAREGQAGFMIGHEEEYERLVETLARPLNPNALLVGESGIGKETIIEHLAFRLVKDDVPKALFDKRLVGLHLQNLVAGATPEMLNQRLKNIVEEIYMAGNIILFVPDLHDMVKTSGAAYLSAADALMPVITSNEFPIVGATYPKEFKQYLEPRSDFTGAFEVIHVQEITPEQAQRVLIYESLILEQQNDISISFGAIKRAVVLAKKYFSDKFLPSSAEELLKSALVSAEQRGEKTIGPELITSTAEGKVNIPMHEADEDESEKLLHMEDTIHERLVGQDEAVGAVSEALREYRSGIARHGGPIASFLFVGPTGVGKTELAKTLAAIQFGSEKTMVRFDMTEYQDKPSFARFIGSPDGATTGALTEAVRLKPYSLILLDEFEKAYPDILNLFLQVFDDGRLTDNVGRTVDFSNTIIIATSNAHSDIMNDALSKGETMAEIQDYLKQRLTDVFKPELLNRFSKIIVFKNLLPAELVDIVQINLAELAETLKTQGIFLSFDEAAVQRLAQMGYDPAFGARPLRRVLDEKLRAPLSNAILAKTIVKGARVKLVLKDATAAGVAVAAANAGEFDFVSEV